jgi:FkbM family methyltransferase
VQVVLMRLPARTYWWLRRAGVFARYFARRPHDPDYRAFATVPVTSLFLDVGANAGQSALSFRLYNRDAPILSIEANAHLEPDLRVVGRVISGHRYLIAAAGEHNGELQLNTPLYHGTALTSFSWIGDGNIWPDEEWWTASFLGRAETDDLSFRRATVPVCRLDDLHLDPGVVKLDVEGAELGVLRGLLETITRCRPLILIEVSPALRDIRALLEPIGYACNVFSPDQRAFAEYTGQRTVNVFFVPQESWP